MKTNTSSLFALFAILTFALSASSVHALGSASGAPLNPEELHTWCESRLLRLKTIRGESDALACADFYFSNQGFEKEGELFEKSLQYLERAIELNPQNFDSLSSAIWLHYSRWSTSNLDPTYVQYSGDLKIAYVLSNRAETFFKNNAEGLKAIADQLFPIWEFYDKSLFTKIVGLYDRAQSLSHNNKMIIRCRLNIAHLYRKAGNIQTAKQKYLWVLDIDPGNIVAKRYLKQLG